MTGADRDGLRDAGLFDIGAVRSRIRRAKLRAGLKDLVTGATALLHLLDQDAEATGNERAARLQRAIGLACGDQEGVVDERPVLRVKCDEKGEEQLLEGIDLITQLLGGIERGLGQGMFSCSVADRQPIRDAELAHRLSETAK